MKKKIAPYINIGLTTGGCNRNCDHCLTSMDTSTEDFSFENAKKLASSIRMFLSKHKQERVHICLNNGEPLLNSRVADIIELLLKAHSNISLSIITSGFLEGCEEEKERLRKIAMLWEKYGKDLKNERLSITLSFHDFSPTFAKRLETTLKFLFEKTPVERVSIKMTFAFDDENVKSTRDKLEKVMKKVGFDGPFWINLKEERSEWLIDTFGIKVYSQKHFDEISDLAFMLDCFYACRDENNKLNAVKVQPQPLAPLGRGYDLFKPEDLKIYPWRSFLLHCPIISRRDLRLRLDEKGVWYVGDCPQEQVFRLGSLKNVFRKVLDKREKMTRIAIPRLLSPRDEEIKECEICRQVWGAP